MKEPDDHDALWQLLGKARPPAVSPYFARRVVREVSQSGRRSEGPSFLSWLLRNWQVPAMAACAVAIAGGALNRPGRPSSSPARYASPEPTLAALPDLGVIGHLDELIDSENNSVWLGGDAE